MRIRELTMADYDSLVQLWEESGLPYRPKGRDRRDRIAAQINEPWSVFLAAEEDGRLLGAVLGTHDGRRGWINRLVVSPAYRKRGIGAALVAEVEARLESCGIEIFTCLIETWNEDSMRFFERIGFVEHDECVYYSKRKNPDV